MTLLAQFLGPLLALSLQVNSTSPASKNLLTSADKKAIVEKHNEYRKEVDVAPLVWDDQLEAYALEWASQIKRGCQLKHRPYQGKYKQKYGENIAISYDDTPVAAVLQWGSEKKDFKLRTMRTFQTKFLYKVGHYTQIIWAKTKRVGCARVKCSNGNYIMVCNYDPPGNYRGEKVY